MHKKNEDLANALLNAILVTSFPDFVRILVTQTKSL